jgi:mannose-6-phosphate isomerase-like protein (cupin superfamily)
MSRSAISSANAEHYTWGGPNRDLCDGWHLLRAPELSIIEESMPPGTSETRHYHRHARQFFYVLEGTLTMEVSGAEFVLQAGQGMEIDPGASHQAINRGYSAARFLVTSQPPSHGDRVEEPGSLP